MSRYEKKDWKKIIDKEFVRVATAEEASGINFLSRANKKNTVIKKDPSLEKIVDILKENPEAVVLVIDTNMDRVPVLRKNLEELGIPVQTREAVDCYNQSTDPFTIAIRRVNINRTTEHEEEKVEKPKVIKYKKR